MMVGVRGDLREMRDAQNLPSRTERLQLAADGRSDGAADAGIDFVEYQRRHVADFARDDLYGQCNPRQFAA